LFLDDDMVPEPELVERHLARHARDPAAEVAVLGAVRWHPEVTDGRLMGWLERSGAHFDPRLHAGGGGEEVDFGRLHSSNLSIKRELFLQAGGFAPDFRVDYEDLDLGWRLHEHGMRLLYEPGAVALHLHRYDWASVERRYESRARAEREMLSRHDWFSPRFRQRIEAHDGRPTVSPAWPHVVDLVPERARWLRARAEARAERRYHQRLAPRFQAAWEGERDLEELRAYLGENYDQTKLVHSSRMVDEEAAGATSEAGFYRTSELYLYDLTVFAMSGTKEPYRRVLSSLLRPGARVLDYGCGIGSDGLRLLEAGYRVSFADFSSPSTRYLRWRLARRGLSAEVYDLDGVVPDGFDAAYAFDVIEHVEDAFAFLAELERRAAVVVVNLLEPVPGDTPLHRSLPIGAILAHATDRGLLRYRRYYGRSHLIAYRGTPAPGSGGVARLRSRAERLAGSVWRT
ncbi:MAG TPA: methyltransferase, partial [Solirubrobacteraceae bacterium]